MINNFPVSKKIFVIHSEKDNYLIKKLEEHFLNIYFGYTNFIIEDFDFLCFLSATVLLCIF